MKSVGMEIDKEIEIEVEIEMAMEMAMEIEMEIEMETDWRKGDGLEEGDGGRRWRKALEEEDPLYGHRR